MSVTWYININLYFGVEIIQKSFEFFFIWCYRGIKWNELFQFSVDIYILR